MSFSSYLTVVLPFHLVFFSSVFYPVSLHYLLIVVHRNCSSTVLKVTFHCLGLQTVLSSYDSNKNGWQFFQESYLLGPVVRGHHKDCGQGGAGPH
jgi:hypothetical protein